MKQLNFELEESTSIFNADVLTMEGGPGLLGKIGKSISHAVKKIAKPALKLATTGLKIAGATGLLGPLGKIGSMALSAFDKLKGLKGMAQNMCGGLFNNMNKMLSGLLDLNKGVGNVLGGLTGMLGMSGISGMCGNFMNACMQGGMPFMNNFLQAQTTSLNNCMQAFDQMLVPQPSMMFQSTTIGLIM